MATFWSSEGKLGLSLSPLVCHKDDGQLAHVGTVLVQSYRRTSVPRRNKCALHAEGMPG